MRAPRKLPTARVTATPDNPDCAGLWDDIFGGGVTASLLRDGAKRMQGSDGEREQRPAGNLSDAGFDRRHRDRELELASGSCASAWRRSTEARSRSGSMSSLSTMPPPTARPTRSWPSGRSWTSCAIRKIAALPQHAIRAPKRARAPLLLFLNPDVRVRPDTVAAAVRYLDDPDHSGVGVLGAQLIDADGHVQRCCARTPTAATLVAADPVP